MHLTESLLRIQRTVLGRLLVPLARLSRIGRDASHILLPKHGWIVGLSQQEGGAGLLRVRGPFQQQSRGREVPYRDQTLCPLQQGREFVGIEPSCRRRGSGVRSGGGGSRSDGGRSHGDCGRRRNDFRLTLMGGSESSSDFVARRRTPCGRRHSPGAKGRLNFRRRLVKASRSYRDDRFRSGSRRYGGGLYRGGKSRRCDQKRKPCTF